MKKFLVLFLLTITLLLIVSLVAIYAGSQNPVDQQGMSSLSGKVVETMNSSGYTYVNIEKDGEKTWVAVPQMKVSVGQDISFQPGMAMSNFTSKTLKRTFETIVFSSGPVGQHGTESTSKPVDQKQAKVPANMIINVKKASGPDAYTVAGLYEKSRALDGKDVVVRGQVVKFSANIMGKNWIHIQDGSGSPSKGTNDIPVTSQDILSVGDIVTVKGTLYKDKDFGGGYKYAVIVEQATIKK